MKMIELHLAGLKNIEIAEILGTSKSRVADIRGGVIDVTPINPSVEDGDSD